MKTINLGYYYYKEYETTKTIYVFAKESFDGNTERWYYLDIAECSIRSFSADNDAFISRTEKIDDIEAIKIYDIQLLKEIEELKQQQNVLIAKLAHSAA